MFRMERLVIARRLQSVEQAPDVQATSQEPVVNGVLHAVVAHAYVQDLKFPEWDVAQNPFAQSFQDSEYLQWYVLAVQLESCA